MRAARIDVARAGEALRAELLLARQLVIVAGRAADEHAAAAAGQRLRVVAGVLDAVPARLQEQALLRIHALGLARRDVEEQRIEQVDVVQRAQPFAVGLAGHGLAGLVVRVDVPAAFGYLARCNRCPAAMFAQNSSRSLALANCPAMPMTAMALWPDARCAAARGTMRAVRHSRGRRRRE